jgi:DNA polymerase V
MRNDAMINSGIFPGDEIIVDRSLTPKSGNIVVAVVDDDFLIRKLQVQRSGSNERAVLQPTNSKYPTYQIAEFSDLRIWGVVTKTLHTPH